MNKLDSRKTLRRFILFSPQITVMGAAAVVLLVALIILTVFVVAQVQASAEVLTFNDANRVFIQLQRETLRALVLMAEPAERYDASTLQTQVDLIESRIGVMNFPQSQAAFPPDIRTRAQQIDQQWSSLRQQIADWKAAPADSALQESITQGLADLERYANETGILYDRARNRAVVEFAQLNQRQLLGFVIGAVILMLFMATVATSIYRFNQQRQEVEAARETNRLKDEFLAVVSHELRTPLNAIIGFLGIMKMTRKLDERTLHMVERAHANALRLLSLINDILDVSKIEAGKFELSPTAVPARKMIERWQGQMDVLAKQKGLEFEVYIDDDLPESLYIDEDAVTKIATNLLANAFKFTEKGQVSLHVKPDGPGEWLIRVSDTGIGIPESARDHIFENFRQVDGSTRRMYGGSGLGLSIVRRLANAMGGRVEVESVVGEGSTFTVRIPLVAVAQVMAVQPA